MIEYDSITLKPNVVIQFDVSDDGTPQLALINHLIQINLCYYICLQKLIDRGVDWHFHAYVINISNEFFNININDLKYRKTMFIQNMNSSTKLVNIDSF